MHKAVSIAKATALEILSEPLSLLVTLSSLALSVYAPVLHYHQFGEATRMARDAGFSSLFLGGAVFAVFGTLKTFRRELESGTADMALSHSVSRGGFFLAKVAGAFAAFVVFAVTVFGTSLMIVEGSAIGGEISIRTGEIARVFGPCVVGGTAVLLLPLLVAASLNRFGRFRFVLSFHALAFVLAALPFLALPVFDHQLLAYFPVAALVASLPVLLMTAAAAFAVPLRANAACAAVGLTALAFLPAVGNYYLADALAKGGAVPLRYVLAALAALVPLIAALLFVGVKFLHRRG